MLNLYLLSMLNKFHGIRQGRTVYGLLFPDLILKWHHNADILENFVKLDILIYNEFNNIILI